MRRDFLIYIVLEELFKKFQACVLRSAVKFKFRWQDMAHKMGGNAVSHSRDVH